MKNLILFFTVSAISLIMFSFESKAQNTDSDKTKQKVEITIRKSVDGVVQTDTTIVYDSPADFGNFRWHGKNNFNMDVLSSLGDSAFHRMPRNVRVLGFHNLLEAGDSLKLDSLQSRLKGVMLHDMRRLGAARPGAGSAIHFMHRNNENVIDLSDDDIISYKKKKRSGGREKIVILRKEKTEEEKNAANSDVFHYQIDRESPFPVELNRPKPVRELNINKSDIKP